MDFFTIGGTLWRHKRVSIPLVFLTLLGMLYVVALMPSAYQASADLLLTSPPAPPSASQIAQDPSLAKLNNPLANLGDLTYVADVLIDVVSAPAAEQALAQAGASGYHAILADSDQNDVPPTIAVTGTGPNAQAAIQSAQVVAAAISRDLNQLQVNQGVQSKSMITVVEYVTPTSAVKASGRLEKAIGVAAIGLIVLLVAVSIAQGREEQKTKKSRQERSAHRGGRRHEPAESMAELPYGEPSAPYGQPRPSMRMDESYPPGPARRPGVQPTGGGNSVW